MGRTRLSKTPHLGFVTFLLFFQTVSAVPEQHSGLNRAALQVCCERSLKYLEHYHKDFKKLRIGFALETSVNSDIWIRDTQDNILKHFSVTADTFNRRIFDELANLLLDAQTSIVSRSALDSLGAAWYWDALSIENPAVFDQVNASEPGNGIKPSERIAFWRYRLLVQQNGGRDGLWKRVKSSPSLIEILDPTQPLSEQDTLELLELKSYRLSPVQRLDESEMLLRSLHTFRFSHPVLEKTRWVSLEKLPKKQLEEPSSVFLEEVKHRLLLIKSALPSTNPLFLNAFQSLGVCFERLLDQDSAGYQAAMMRFLHDLAFAKQVQDEICARRDRTQAN